MLAEIAQKEVHVVVGCADARDVGGIFADALDAVRSRYAARGVAVDFHALRTPGSFVTRDVVDDLRRIVDVEERGPFERVRYFVHIQSHGEVRIESGVIGPAMGRFSIVQGSKFNCGMLGASSVSVDLERFILERRPTIRTHERSWQVRDEEDLRALLDEVYAHRGSLAGDWIRSIDDLRTHPRLQESVLREEVSLDRTLRSVDLTITSGIQDYRQHHYFRLDAHPEAENFWDEVYAQLRERASRLPASDDEILQRTATQAPELGLFSTCDLPHARAIAASHLVTLGRQPKPFRPNQVFTFASESFDLPHSPFGPYTVAGFYYAVVNLKLKDFVVVGHDAAQTRRMISRLEHDPLINLIATAFGVRYHPTTLAGDTHAPNGVSRGGGHSPA